MPLDGDMGEDGSSADQDGGDMGRTNGGVYLRSLSPASAPPGCTVC